MLLHPGMLAELPLDFKVNLPEMGGQLTADGEGVDVGGPIIVLTFKDNFPKAVIHHLSSIEGQVPCGCPRNGLRGIRKTGVYPLAKSSGALNYMNSRVAHNLLYLNF